ncbi:MAG: TetR/AcrR family transcriptional regulator [Alphaproteobacteria bacterium]|nr:TetR/AcrR family transcriptional regulator [Alphaproteobacteria bacterium]
MGRPREHDEHTREALRAAAERLFDERGAAGVTVRALADAVGTTTRAVYSLFGSRDGLLIDALSQRAYELLERGLDDQLETDDPARDVVEAGVGIFRPFVREHPALFRIAFQRVLPSFEPGPELVAARASAFRRLCLKVGRAPLGGKPPEVAALEFQALCEGLGNFELRGNTLRLLPDGAEDATWRGAFVSLVAGWRVGADG